MEDIFAYGNWFGEYYARFITELADEARAGHVAIEPVIDLPAGRSATDPYLEEFSGRTVEHKRLCAMAADWISNRGGTPEWCALGYQGGVADVAELRMKLFVECGYTRAGKILDALSVGQRILVLPYSGYGNAQQAFLFTRLAPLRRETEDIFELRAAINKAFPA